MARFPVLLDLGAADEAARAAVLRTHGARAGEVDELLAYTRNGFRLDSLPELPLPDEVCVAAWGGYVAVASADGVYPCLRERLVQLQFPVSAGASGTAAYLAATRRGVLPGAGDGIRLRQPEALRLFLHPTPAGRVPVIVAEAREDFVALVQALTCRNEPQPVPDSMGACIVGGYNNWDRVRAWRRGWEAERGGGTEEEWSEAFRELIPRRDLYQDRFILLSAGPYSGVPAAALGVSEAEWMRLSLRIRLEHECTHYFTRRVFGTMRNALLDELLADYAGLRAAIGAFRADWFLRFMGLESFPAYREGGRLENYRGEPPLSDGSLRVLYSLVHSAARGLELWDAARGAAADDAARLARLLALAGASLESLARLADARPVRGASRRQGGAMRARTLAGGARHP